MKSLMTVFSILIGFSAASFTSNDNRTVDKVVAQHLIVGDSKIEWGHRGDAYPVLMMKDSKIESVIQAGVHENGFPFVLVSDQKVRNFGLGRVDGKMASPILVFRHEDVVRMVFGLSMTEPGKNPFLVHYSDSGTQVNQIGSYCKAPSRACTH